MSAPNESGTTVIVPLDPTLIADAAVLLAAYLPDKHPDRLIQARRSLERLLRYDAAQLLLARRATGLVGFAAISWGFSTTGMPILRIQDLFTAPQARRTGVASALLAHLCQQARQRGANRIQLETAIDNLAARRLYERAGFECFPANTIYMLFV